MSKYEYEGPAQSRKGRLLLGEARLHVGAIIAEFNMDGYGVQRAESARNPIAANVNPRPTGGGYFEPPPPLVFLRYLLNQCRYHHQTCSTLSPNNFTHCVKILKSRVL